MHLHATHSVSDRAIKSVANSVAFRQAQGRSCARICARMTALLLAGRERDCDREKSRSRLVNGLPFETKRNVLKSTISES
jgi:hypothetical protein